ncbi:DUF3817 domain-containing protein [Longirhabdus pacifica]|uniref:DUF3817 domain-containing protein n=1 Tax=Longirhabdus pacifica TaxID=2305227 RepID=UPI0010088449|nr:DUF3817 domain-containing protein [Longirhabdus pacifica]
MLKSPVEQVRLSGFIEGMSFIILLFIAMPLKYIWDIPEAVSVVGSMHGVLFVIYMLAIALAFFTSKLSFRWSFGAVLVAFIPFGYFIYDAKLKQSRYWNKK